jgi:patatin-related protein
MIEISEKLEDSAPSGHPACSSSPVACRVEDADIEREIRFAVVIYGGVSLTIYINGIVQELLHLVRSTAGKVGKLSEVEQVYQELATWVGAPRPEIPSKVSDDPDSARQQGIRHRPGKAFLVSKQKVEQGDKRTVRSRFVVDILSGTSAGGINAIYLAKALACNLSIDSLSEMWITQADLKLLLNDRDVNPGYLRQDPPQSLLNAPWMYLQLLTALNKMNPTEEKRDCDGLVQDLDLFCTTTDLRGLPVGIALTDETVEEHRYRNFYHFKRRTADGLHPGHDFIPAMDPFLAFAARCTSSFPVAFEPMELRDIMKVVNRRNFREYLGSESPDETVVSLFGRDLAQLKGASRFAEICRIYRNAVNSEVEFCERPFGDGGYLDNKPFTYAIETMKTRHANLPVDRKLIYIEPSPEDFVVARKSKKEKPSDEDDQCKGKLPRPNVIDNSLDALVILPRYEAIRQDIESVIRWNADISRLHRVIDSINTAVDGTTYPTREELKSLPWCRTYYRLRLSGTADQLGDRLSVEANVDPTSAQGQAMRSIAGIWRELRYGSWEQQ